MKKHKAVKKPVVQSIDGVPISIFPVARAGRPAVEVTTTRVVCQDYASEIRRHIDKAEQEAAVWWAEMRAQEARKKKARREAEKLASSLV